MSKSSLAVELSKLKIPLEPNTKLEQYPTDSEVAAHVLWDMHMLGEIEDKVVADLGCGGGILGVGALILGAKKVYFVDIDAKSLAVAKENCTSHDLDGCEFIQSDISDIDRSQLSDVDIVIQNPPFGTREKHIDKKFLEKAFELADTVISFHKESTADFVRAISRDHGFLMPTHWNFDFPLKRTRDFHKKRLHRIDVGCWRLKRLPLDEDKHT